MSLDNMKSPPTGVTHHHSKKSSLGDFQYSQPNVVFQVYDGEKCEKSFSLIDNQSSEASKKGNPAYKEAISSINQQFGQSVSAYDNHE